MDMSTKHWEMECRSELQMPHENEVFLKFVLLAKLLGYEYVAIGLELPLSIAEPWVAFFANYANDWQEKFVEHPPKHHGPKTSYGKRTVEPDPANPAYYWTTGDFDREARLHGITADWADKIEGLGNSIARVALAGRESEPSTELDAKTRMLVDLAAESMTNILTSKYAPQMSIQLSHTERAYLSWVLEGKTTSEIAEIMSISKGSVENMQRKLPERFQRNGIFITAFLAFRLGMLSR